MTEHDAVRELVVAWDAAADARGTLAPEAAAAFPSTTKGRRALEAATRAHALRPTRENRALWGRLGAAYLALSWDGAAFEIFDALVALDDADVNAREHRGLSSLGMRAWHEALADFRRVLLDEPERALATTAMTYAQARLGDTDAASALRALAEHAPDARRFLTELERTLPADMNTHLYETVHLPLVKLSEQLLDERDWGRVLAATALILQLNAGREAGWRLRSRALEGLGRSDDAIACARRAAEWSPPPNHFVQLGILLGSRNGAGDREEAVRWFQKAVKLAKHTTFARHWLTYTLLQLGRDADATSEALTAARSLQRTKDAPAKSHYEVAAMLALTSQIDASLASLERALALDPSLAKRAARDDDLAHLRGHEAFARLV